MLSKKYIATLWFALAMLALVPLPANGQTILFEDFEAGWGSWFADNGVWGVGTPTAGPASCYTGTQCAGTVLGGNYPVNTDSRLISPTVTLPGLSSGEEIHVVFESWFDYGDDSGWVQISTWDGATGTWSDWQTVGQFIGNGGSPVWSLTGRDISAYEGETVRIAFYHTADTFGEAAGWYVDDVVIVKRTPAFGGDFESGWGDWYTENGVWEVGTPTAGPASCYTGTQCAGTVLGGNYPVNTDSRLISPTVTLPGLSSGEEIHVVFESWFDYGDDSGWVQISTWDGATGTWSDWQTVGQFIGNGGSPVWSLTGRDISAYEGETVRIAFYHTADTFGEAAGWYVDDVVIVKRTPAFGGDFESGWGDWYTENGVWEVGTPTAGPASCYTGTQCAGTVLGGNYPVNTDSRLISPTVTLPGLSSGEEIHVVFESWFDYGDDSGWVQISTWDGATGTWSDWQTVGQFIGNGGSPVWSLTGRDISAYEGETVRIAFYHTADTFGEAAGWYVDDVVIVKRTPAFGGDFESGWGDWYTENGVWEVGTPTAGPASCYTGTQCAGTVLGGNYPVNTDSRLISPTVTLPGLSSGEEIHVVFESWFDYGDDSGWVQISTWDGATGTWSDWQTVGQFIGNGGSPVWSLTGRDISAYEGETVRIAFYHTADTFGEAAGWYVDDVVIVKRTPAFGGDFESGWGDWYTENGVWEVGTPTAGPASCYTGTQCAGTVLGGNYPVNTDSRLISPTVTLTRTGTEPITLRFFHWFAYGDDLGRVQISSFDAGSGEWSAWTTIGPDITDSSSVWSPTVRDLTAYDGEKVRIAFYHIADTFGEATGWYIDNIEITGIVLDKTLTVTLSGTGSGSVTSAPPGIDCPGDCSEAYVDPIDVTLTPIADAGSFFSGWSGDCSGLSSDTVTMVTSRACEATFDLVSHNVTVNLSGTGSGVVTSARPGIDCPTDCTKNYPHGDLVRLTATADPGSSFEGWSGDCTGTAPFDLTVDSAKRCTATFNAGDTCGTFIINQTETTNAPTMRTTVTVLDNQGDPVQGLDASDFTLDEDSEFRVLTLVTPPDPLSVGLVIDTSGSISSVDLAKISTASKDFIDLLEVTDSVAVYDFDNDVKLLQDYTTDRDAAKAAIDLLASGGSTAMADALFKAGLDAQPLTGRQGLILMSDGYENSSSRSVQEGIDAALAAGVPVFTIGFGNQDAITLQDIATQTGGEYFSGAGAAELAAILASIGSRLTNQYELEWTTGFCDGQEHALDMTVSFGALPSCDLAASSIYSQEGSTCGPSCTAVRDLPVGYTPEIGVRVCVGVTGTAVSSYAVEDVPPSSWVVDEGSIDNGGIYDSNNNKVKWGPFFDQADRALCYTVTPQSGTSGCELWDGSVSLTGVPEGLCGDLELCAGGVHPSDLDDNFSILIDEMTAYTGAWKDGSPWPRAPSPVTTAYAVNAATIWRNGEFYHFDPNATPVPFVADATSLFAALTLAAGVEAALPTTERSFESDGADPGIPVTVSIAVTPEGGTLGWAVEETPPEGWTITDISDGGIFDDQAKQVRWGVFLDTTPRILTYDVTPPSVCGNGQFEGEVVFDSTAVTIGGATLLSCTIIFKDGFE